MLLRKKKTTTGSVALIGGFQSHAFRFRYRCIRAKATNALTMARGYDMRLRRTLVSWWSGRAGTTEILTHFRMKS
jgi:hypothetical protein